MRNVFSVAHADVFHSLTSLIAPPIGAILCLALLLCLSPPSVKAAQPLGLKDLIVQAIAGHPSVAAVRAESGAAGSEVAAARYQYYPSPSAQVLYDKGASTTIFALQQPLWAGGRIDAGLDSALAKSQASQVAIDEAGYNLALRLTASWAAWAQAKGRSEALGEGLALLRSYDESVARRIKGGASAEVDRDLVAARLAQIEGDLAASRSAGRSALARLSQMLGRPLTPEDLAPVEVIVKAGPQPTLDALVTLTLAHSATIKRLEAELLSARHEVARKRAAIWPTLSLRAQHRRDELTGTELTANDSRFMLAFDFAPGAGLSAGAGIEAAESRLLAQREHLETARRDLVEKISADYEEQLAGRERLREIERSVRANQQVLASYDRLFAAGRRGWLDVINAARELIQLRVSQADAEAVLIAASARLVLHTGELP